MVPAKTGSMAATGCTFKPKHVCVSPSRNQQCLSQECSVTSPDSLISLIGCVYDATILLDWRLCADRREFALPYNNMCGAWL